MLSLTNRELATAILLGAIALTFTIVPKLRAQVGESLLGVLKAFFAWKIQVSLMAYGAYAGAVVAAAHWIELWRTADLKDTIFVVALLGFPLLFSAHEIEREDVFLRDVLRKVASPSALAVFYLNLGALPLWGELVVQPLATLLATCSVVAQGDPELAPGRKLCNALLSLIGLLLLVQTTRQAIGWDGHELSAAARSLLVSIWLPLALVPYVYVYGFAIQVGAVFTMLRFFNGEVKPSLRVRLAGVIGFRGRTALVSEFNGHWRGDLARSGGYRAASRVMSQFRHAVKTRDQSLREYRTLLLSNSGAPSVGADGLVRDRREFDEAKRSLTNIYYQQLGWLRNRQAGGFRADVGAWDDVPGVTIEVSPDRQAWMAYRSTPSGYVFGVGGRVDRDDSSWQYDGWEPPTTLPPGDEDESGRVDATGSASSPEWVQSDTPPSRP